MRLTVGQPILAAAGFQPALRGSKTRASPKEPSEKAAAGKIACPTKLAELRPHYTSGLTAVTREPNAQLIGAEPIVPSGLNEYGVYKEPEKVDSAGEPRVEGRAPALLFSRAHLLTSFAGGGLGGSAAAEAENSQAQSGQGERERLGCDIHGTDRNTVTGVHQHVDHRVRYRKARIIFQPKADVIGRAQGGRDRLEDGVIALKRRVAPEVGTTISVHITPIRVAIGGDLPNSRHVDGLNPHAPSRREDAPRSPSRPAREPPPDWLPAPRQSSGKA